MSRLGFRRVKGFTLIEVLVSTIILAIGLLGLAAMQTMALKDNQDAFFYSQASSLAYEMSDRIKVNAVAWQDPTALPPDTPCNRTCDFANPCPLPDDMATYDYCAWKNNVQSRIDSTATATVTVSGNTGVCSGGISRRCLTISWARNKQLGTQATNIFQLEIQP